MDINGPFSSGCISWTRGSVGRIFYGFTRYGYRKPAGLLLPQRCDRLGIRYRGLCLLLGFSSNGLGSTSKPFIMWPKNRYTLTLARGVVFLVFTDFRFHWTTPPKFVVLMVCIRLNTRIAEAWVRHTRQNLLVVSCLACLQRSGWKKDLNVSFRILESVLWKQFVLKLMKRCALCSLRFS